MGMQLLNFPNNIDSEKFLADYWQKKPLLLRQALPNFKCQIEADELAGMACEDEIESRLVLEKHGSTPWEARYGPFAESVFTELPESHWTLLIQDVDKYIPEVAKLLDFFRFIPDWRLDDIMISYAVDQGSVGPHTDDYDVFLLQAKGSRRWKIHTQPVAENDYIPGLDLRILPNFKAEQEWLLKAGDMLYLPPNVAHWGIAEGEAITCSVGFRAPTWQEIASSWFESWIEQQLPKQRYRDPALTPQIAPAEIKPAALDGFKARLQSCLDRIDQDERWFGRLVTETKPNLQVVPVEQPLTDQLFLNRFREQAVIHRNSHSRMAFSRFEKDGQDTLYINGSSYTLPYSSGEFLPVITHYRELHFGYLQEWLEQPEYLSLLCRLYNEGHFLFSDRR
jgi:50S ribosomal protein L16 3-hydroxylase